MQKDLRGTWKQAIAAIGVPVFLILFVRWIVVEPYLIPSGSMIPTLQIHDHILVKKFAFGLKLPFAQDWLAIWSPPQRGQIIVFRYPPQPDVFYVKRLIGLPGDKIEMKKGELYINDILQEKKLVEEDSFEEVDQFNYYLESQHYTRYFKDQSMQNFGPVKVPPHNYFMMGDNRDQSADSRFWGTVPEGLLVGTPWLVWLSCSEMLPNASYLCDPQTIRWGRIFKLVH